VKVTGELVVDLARHVDPHGCVPADARKVVGRVLSAAPRGVLVYVELGGAAVVDAAVVRVLLEYAPRHPYTVRGAKPATVSRLVRLLRGEPDELLGGAA
jgi:hypothetical protein